MTLLAWQLIVKKNRFAIVKCPLTPSSNQRAELTNTLNNTGFIFFWCDAKLFFELRNKVGRARKVELVANISYRELTLAEQTSRTIEPMFNIVI